MRINGSQALSHTLCPRLFTVYQSSIAVQPGDPEEEEEDCLPSAPPPVNWFRGNHLIDKDDLTTLSPTRKRRRASTPVAPSIHHPHNPAITPANAQAGGDHAQAQGPTSGRANCGSSSGNDRRPSVSGAASVPGSPSQRGPPSHHHGHHHARPGNYTPARYRHFHQHQHSVPAPPPVSETPMVPLPHGWAPTDYYGHRHPTAPGCAVSYTGPTTLDPGSGTPTLIHTHPILVRAHHPAAAPLLTLSTPYTTHPGSFCWLAPGGRQVPLTSTDQYHHHPHLAPIMYSTGRSQAVPGCSLPQHHPHPFRQQTAPTVHYALFPSGPLIPASAPAHPSTTFHQGTTPGPTATFWAAAAPPAPLPLPFPPPTHVHMHQAAPPAPPHTTIHHQQQHSHTHAPHLHTATAAAAAAAAAAATAAAAAAAYSRDISFLFQFLHVLHPAPPPTAGHQFVQPGVQESMLDSNGGSRLTMVTPPLVAHPHPANLDAWLHLAAHLESSRRRGLNKEELDSLPTRSYLTHPDSEPTSTPDKERCMVCLDDFECDQVVRTLRCRHEFHAKCVDKWLKGKRTCPLCRADAFDGTQHKEEFF